MKKYEDNLYVAFLNGMKLTNILMKDLEELFKIEANDESWYRNFIRCSASLIDGFIWSLKEIALVALDMYTCPEINIETGELFTNKEAKALLEPDALGAKERIKFTLRIAYNVLQLEPLPNFSSKEWEEVLSLIDKRNELMHPKNPESLKISSDSFEQYRSSVKWLLNELNVFKKIDDLKSSPIS